MKRFWFLIVATTLLAMQSTGPMSGAGASGDTADEIHYTITGPASVTFDWRGDPATIAFGATTAYGNTVTAGAPNISPFSSPGPWREAKLVGLQPGATYHYAIGTGSDHTFRTAPVPGSSGFSVVAEADIGDSTSSSNMPTIQGMIPALAPSLVLAAGDLTYGNDHGQAVVDQHFNDVMVWSQDAAYEPAWGNHEWDDQTYDDLRNYKGRFDFANSQTSAGSPAISCCGEDWHWFDYGDVRFIAYPEPWSGAIADWYSKVKPIMADAQSNPNISFIVTYGHRPAYSSGHHPSESELQGDLDSLGSTYSKYVL
ncbi:MAG TPA: metallophosphoesterase family protein, partial [Actinomycetota bacterium]|nr:metallophosphoesterase family protein [Actinomycetota bacterium]